MNIYYFSFLILARMKCAIAERIIVSINTITEIEIASPVKVFPSLIIWI